MKRFKGFYIFIALQSNQNLTLMEYLSTTSLANELDVPTNELFSKLKSYGWIDRKNDKWILTDLGKQKGGQTRNNPKFGEYIVWPENISIDSSNKQKLLNATAIGKYPVTTVVSIEKVQLCRSRGPSPAVFPRLHPRIRLLHSHKQIEETGTTPARG